MKNQDNRPKDAAGLRRKAEALLREKTAQTPEDLAVLSSGETQRTLHELRVHQIELEIQNEELREAQAELEASRECYFDLYDLAPVGYCTLSEKGLILEANLTAATLLGVARGTLVKQPITRFILKEDQDVYYLHRKQSLKPARRRNASCGWSSRTARPSGRIWPPPPRRTAMAHRSAVSCWRTSPSANKAKMPSRRRTGTQRCISWKI